MMRTLVHEAFLADASVGSMITSEYLKFPVIIISIDRDTYVAASATGDASHPFAIFDISAADERYKWRTCWVS